ncbi:MAG: tetratricopeptide repeat protein [Aquificaceae bacterium]|nr:tetratricopeptide repeat protein [Aquificaceae bacterium]MDW8066112.1 tetratricopeptide repeat protein [Aquificaceae bacterium]MDW8423436.1 tetratricopeptide repeat protein [Aquificaceae bacterium]
MMERNYKGIFSKMGEGLLEKFIEDLKKELEQRPYDPETLFKLGVAYSRVGKVSEAREVYKKLKDIDKEKAKELLDIIYGT